MTVPHASTWSFSHSSHHHGPPPPSLLPLPESLRLLAEAEPEQVKEDPLEEPELLEEDPLEDPLEEPELLDEDPLEDPELPGVSKRPASTTMNKAAPHRL